MGSIKNVLLHCMKNEQEYQTLKPSDDDGRLINKGWIEALEYVMRNFDVEDRTIKQKGDK